MVTCSVCATWFSSAVCVRFTFSCLLFKIYQILTVSSWKFIKSTKFIQCWQRFSANALWRWELNVALLSAGDFKSFLQLKSYLLNLISWKVIFDSKSYLQLKSYLWFKILSLTEKLSLILNLISDWKVFFDFLFQLLHDHYADYLDGKKRINLVEIGYCDSWYKLE